MIRLKELRTKKKATQLQVAKMLNTSQQTYARYESGQIEPNIQSIMLLAKYFNVSTDYLLGMDNFLLQCETEDNDITIHINKCVEGLTHTEKKIVLAYIDGLKCKFDNFDK